MTGPDAPVLLRREGAVAHLVLNRPAVGNAIDAAMARALLQAAIACDEDASVRCVVLSGQGRMFCVGGDVAAFRAAGPGVGALIKEITADLHSAIACLARMAKPLVSVANGPAAGAGLGLAVLGDIALAGRSAHFTCAYTALGVSPDGATSWLLPRLIGLRRAQELMLLNPRIDAEAAAAMGLVTRVVDDLALEAEVMAVVRRLAAGATRAIGRTRALLRDGFGAGLEAHMAAEARAIAASALEADGQEGIAAFLERRAAVFAG